MLCLASSLKINLTILHSAINFVYGLELDSFLMGENPSYFRRHHGRDEHSQPTRSAPISRLRRSYMRSILLLLESSDNCKVREISKRWPIARCRQSLQPWRLDRRIEQRDTLQRVICSFAVRSGAISSSLALISAPDTPPTATGCPAVASLASKS